MKTTLILLVALLGACASIAPKPVATLPDDLKLMCHDGQVAVGSPSLGEMAVFGMKCV